MSTLLEVKDLNVTFDTRKGPLPAVSGVSFEIQEGKTLGIVGESGSGKSVTNLAIMGLLPETAKIEAQGISFQGKNLLELKENQLREMRGGELAMIFQDPMSSLNPSFTVEFQIAETLEVHQKDKFPTKEKRRERVVQLLDQVGIPDPRTRLNSYPHQLSGGMSQRVMIAMAIACNAKLLIADEPTTALDVTIQTQVLELLRELQEKNHMGLILITHDIHVVAQMADQILVMYAGQIVESGKTDEVIANPIHPYTKSLLECLPSANLEKLAQSKGARPRLPTIDGLVPNLIEKHEGCLLHPRCLYVQDKCRTVAPPVTRIQGRLIRCYYPLNEGEKNG